MMMTNGITIENIVVHSQANKQTNRIDKEEETTFWLTGKIDIFSGIFGILLRLFLFLHSNKFVLRFENRRAASESYQKISQ